MKNAKVSLTLLMIILTSAAYGLYGHTSSAASSTELSNADIAISSAYVAVYNAEIDGANVTSLVQQLNTAIVLVQASQFENSTSPQQASSDLETAVHVANDVSAQAVHLGQVGASTKDLQTSESIGAIAGVITVTVMFYIFGDRFYRFAWRLLYRHYVVRPADE